MLAEGLSGVAVAGLATWAGFQSMWPTSQVYGRTFIGLERGSPYHRAHLRRWPQRSLDPAPARSSRASFGEGDVLCVGQVRPAEAGDRSRARRRRTRHRQSQLGPSPADLRVERRIAPPGRANTVRHLRCLWRDADVVPPALRWTATGTLSAVRKLGLEPVMWNVTCYDWKSTSADKVVAHAQRQIRGRRRDPDARRRPASDGDRPRPLPSKPRTASSRSTRRRAISS